MIAEGIKKDVGNFEMKNNGRQAILSDFVLTIF